MTNHQQRLVGTPTQPIHPYRKHSWFNKRTNEQTVRASSIALFITNTAHFFLLMSQPPFFLFDERIIRIPPQIPLHSTASTVWDELTMNLAISTYTRFTIYTSRTLKIVLFSQSLFDDFINNVLYFRKNAAILSKMIKFSYNWYQNDLRIFFLIYIDFFRKSKGLTRFSDEK